MHFAEKSYCASLHWVHWPFYWFCINKLHASRHAVHQTDIIIMLISCLKKEVKSIEVKEKHHVGIFCSSQTADKSTFQMVLGKSWASLASILSSPAFSLNTSSFLFLLILPLSPSPLLSPTPLKFDQTGQECCPSTKIKWTLHQLWLILLLIIYAGDLHSIDLINN